MTLTSEDTDDYDDHDDRDDHDDHNDHDLQWPWKWMNMGENNEHWGQ